MEKISKLFILIIVAMNFHQPLVSEAKTNSWIESWEKATIAIGIKDTIDLRLQNNTILKKEIFKVIGTGVIFYVKVDSIVIPTLVTAKHIFYNPKEKWYPDSLRIRFSWFEDKAIDEYFGIPIYLKENGRKNWFTHPDSSVDLACLSIFFLKGDIGIEKLPILPYSQFASDDDLYQGANIFVLGYPVSIGMEFWTKAILREGIISWIAPIEPGKNRILIDCNVFPGNSGGPVFKMPNGIDKQGNLVLGGKYKFLGIVSERRLSPNPIQAMGHGPIIINPQGSALYSLESMGIGVIEPCTRVLELLNEFKKNLQNKFDTR